MIPARSASTGAILGIGSVLMGDDGVGPHFVRTFEAGWQFPRGVTVTDLGTPGPELYNYLVGHRYLLVIDAVRAGGEPGEVCRYDKQQILNRDGCDGRSAHDPCLHGALLAAELNGKAPAQVVLIGVVPARVELHAGLSPAVSDAIPDVECAVLRQLEEWGIEPRRCPEPDSPDLWWLET